MNKHITQNSTFNILYSRGFTLIRTRLRRNLVNVRGFTLIELLVSISIIAIISTVLLANFNAARERGRDAQRKADLRNIQTALRIFYNDYEYYPASGTGANSGKIIGCGQSTPPGPFTCEYGSQWSADNKVIMSTLPKDPLSSQAYQYTQSGLDSYTLQACLENKSDDKGKSAGGAAWCPSNWMYEVKP
jgi:prepilin-type N-terminal cleavage/methylation domain-containing protein